MRTIPAPTTARREHWHDSRAQLDADVHQIDLPPRYFNQLHALKVSIRIVRNLRHNPGTN
ncbi:hypothetical protein IMCC9480_1405 [Oxalobacteraceae bacterium IMCC9480]|nr:hypothetical protein IMCC9480_1405 [Oxalobacteraceae bacterium IMCC9480]